MIHSPQVIIDFDPSSVKKHVSLGYNIVAVDVLRATSTITVAIAQGAKEVIVCAEIDEAKSYKESANALLVGERHAEIIPGFDFTNSPLDLAQEDLTGKTLAITTSTGTRVIAEGKGAENILIGSTINARAVAQKIHQIKGNWAIIGAGTRGDFRPEDKVGCALIVKCLLEMGNIHTDSPTQDLVNKFSKDIESHIRNSLSAKKLVDIGRQQDVDFVIDKLNEYNLVPRVKIIKQGMEERLSVNIYE